MNLYIHSKMSPLFYRSLEGIKYTFDISIDTSCICRWMIVGLLTVQRLGHESVRMSQNDIKTFVQVKCRCYEYTISTLISTHFTEFSGDDGIRLDQYQPTYAKAKRNLEM
jgi:hypothetical protein